jgi:mono/diheme cytochrome c family protein
MKKYLASALGLLLLFGCGGEENIDIPDGGVYPDAPPPPPPPPQNITVSGKVTKLGAYLAGEGQYVGQATVLAQGVYPVKDTISADDGTYSLYLPANGQVVFYASKLGYNPTYNPVTLKQADVADQRLYLAENDWLNAIADAHNVNLAAAATCQTPGLEAYQCIYGIAVGRILDDGTAGNGTLRPVAGISKEHFTITGGDNAVNWYVKGPYFLETNGTPNAGNLASVVDNATYQGGLYVTFVEIPQVYGPEVITVKLEVTYNERVFGPQYVQIYRQNGVTWSSIYETGLVPPLPVGPVDFDSQVYPLFLPVNQGGYGCIGCHTNQGGAIPAGGMNLYGGPDEAFASLDPNNYPVRVNLVTPAESLLLKKPLYETNGVQDHPIYAFASPQDPAYKLIYTWIQEGAKRDVVLPPASFTNNVLPRLLGDGGCYACHADGVNANNAPGGFYMGGTPAEIYAELVNEASVGNGGTGETYRVNKNGQVEYSLVLTNPLFGNPEPHPVKIFSSNLDPRYQYIYRWISEGYVYDGE